MDSPLHAVLSTQVHFFIKYPKPSSLITFRHRYLQYRLTPHLNPRFRPSLFLQSPLPRSPCPHSAHAALAEVKSLLGMTLRRLPRYYDGTMDASPSMVAHLQRGKGCCATRRYKFTLESYGLVTPLLPFLRRLATSLSSIACIFRILHPSS